MASLVLLTTMLGSAHSLARAAAPAAAAAMPRVAPVAVNEDVAIPPELAAALGNDPFERAFRTPNARGGDDDETATPTRRNSRRQQRRASQQRAAGGGSPSASRSPTGRDRRPTS